MKKPLVRKGLVATIVLLSILICLFPSLNAQSISPDDKPLFDPWVKFDSILQMDYDADDVQNATFQPDGPLVAIPITIRYKAVIPDFLLRAPFLTLKNLWLFGRMYNPGQKLELSTIDEPEWGSFYLTIPNPYIAIDNEFQEVETSVVIALHHNAPAQIYTLKISGRAPTLGRISDAQTTLNIVFQPEWVPCMSIETDDHYIWTPPNKITSVPIYIHNCGNAPIDVRIRLLTNVTGWYITCTPSVVVPVDNSSEIKLYIKPPSDFIGRQQIHLMFSQEQYPPIQPDPDDSPDPIPFYVTAYYLGK
jgi:hypothetical protein